MRARLVGGQSYGRYVVGLVAVVASVTMPATSIAATTSPAFEQSANWPQRYHGAHQRSVNFVETALSPTTVAGLQPAWTFGAGRHFASPPIVVNGTLYTTMPVNSTTGEVVALDAKTGATRWSVTGNFAGTPALVGDHLYVGSVSALGVLTALDPTTGTQIWSATLSSNTHAYTVSSGVVYTAGGGFSDRIAAIDGRDGRIIWAYPSSNNNLAGAPSIDNGVVYFEQSDGVSGEVRALDASTGAPMWHRAQDGNEAVSIANGVLFVATRTKGVQALDARTGKLVWVSNPGRGFATTVAVANGLAYFGSGNRLAAVRAGDGRVRWQRKITVIGGGSPTVANGVVYVGSTDGSALGLDAASGAPLWQAHVGTFAGSPVISNGWVYVSSEDASGPVVTAFALPTRANVQG